MEPALSPWAGRSPQPAVVDADVASPAVARALVSRLIARHSYWRRADRVVCHWSVPFALMAQAQGVPAEHRSWCHGWICACQGLVGCSGEPTRWRWCASISEAPAGAFKRALG